MTATKSKHRNERPTVDPVDALKGFAGTTSRVVQQAALILEEEVAAGVLAAKQIEDRFVNVRELRGDEDNELFHRFRKDSHEVVDILMDMLTVAANYAATLPSKALSIRPLKGRKQAEDGNGSVPVMEIPDPVAPGGKVEMKFVLANSSESETESFSIVGTDLISAEGEHLLARHVRFTPKKVTIKPGETAEARLAISVPKTQKTGVYTGLAQATGKDLRCVITLRVED